MKFPFSRYPKLLALRIASSASRTVTSYRLAVTTPWTSLDATMFFWLWIDSIRSTSTRLASLTWISTVPASETLTSSLLTDLPLGAGSTATGWVAGSAAGAVAGVGAWGAAAPGGGGGGGGGGWGAGGAWAAGSRGAGGAAGAPPTTRPPFSFFPPPAGFAGFAGPAVVAGWEKTAPAAKKINPAVLDQVR